MPAHHFLRVAAASPRLKVAETTFNTDATLAVLKRAENQQVDVVVFPECGLTGYTCGDLFRQPVLLQSAERCLERILSESELTGVAVIGLPVMVDGSVFNAAAVICRGAILGVVPKSYLPNYKEFYDARYFAPACNSVSPVVNLCGQDVPFGTDLLFADEHDSATVLGVEVCEDLWLPVPPSSLQALAGATVLLNLSASNETIGKAAYRRQLVAGQSGRALAAYVYASSGPGESTTDLVFGGHCLIAENGNLLAESPRFTRQEDVLIIQDVDLDRLIHERACTNSFADNRRETHKVFRRIPYTVNRDHPAEPELVRTVEAHPFVPKDTATLTERCAEIFHTQVAGLAGRLSAIGTPNVTIGVSGGLDSTLALLVACKTMDALDVPRTKILAYTMPGFGTTSRTLNNARALMAGLGVTAREADIRSLCLEEWKALGHKPFGLTLDGETPDTFTTKLRHLPPEQRHDLVFENVQARARTSILMNAGFVVGTGDLSELALGWCTYNGDHASMYNPNVSIPKTLVRFLVRHTAQAEFDGDVQRVLLDIAATEISPELLPTDKDGSAVQSTEGTIGPYELHDFFLYHFLRFATPPEKIAFLAGHAKFDRDYSPAEIRHWLSVFLKRFFQNQFKRSFLPDGPKVGSVSLSPRGDWRMPSDANFKDWLMDLG
jgi:NAD+ synthase (glutamine-hydrolysing)